MKKIILAAIAMIALWTAVDALSASSNSVALTGIVSSPEEGAMEGVLVSAERVGGNMSVTVVSDKDGRYSFPSDRLAPGKYQLSIRAIGYDPVDSNLSANVGKGSAHADIKLDKTHDLVSQMSDAEWLMSIPGTQGQKERLFGDCVHCHTLTPVLTSKYDKAGFMTTLVRMRNWSSAGVPGRPMKAAVQKGPAPSDEAFATYLSSINLGSKSKFDFDLKTWPRPKGEDTRVIVTEYDLPRPESQPHDAVVGPDGMIWYCDFAVGAIGRLNPKTGEIREWTDTFHKEGIEGTGFQDLEFDSHGVPWMGRHDFNAFTRFDPVTQKFTNWEYPPPYNNPTDPSFLGAIFVDITKDEKVWVKDNTDNKAFRFDTATGEFRTFNQLPSEKTPHQIVYEIRTDSQGNEYGAGIESGNIFKIDAQSGVTTAYPTPTPKSGPRRMHMDSQDRLWIGEYRANKLAMFDTKTGQFKEWAHPIPWYGAYDVAPDKDGNLWTGAMSTDLITRFNPNTGEFRYYLLPSLGVNVRRVDVDNSGPRPIFWVGENHRAKIAKVEPLP